ncbi:hypothetical protein Egran_02636 [Elaphomyces granulatus]|uniref:Uncharacterized protein n=1 Tax=Elaphomyces granulatus TaxID=519963 RepID=A0A232LZQ5_9EURO|nr:hypothetical protein Egran_02636 [Elaphomyces granulatus]
MTTMTDERKIVRQLAFSADPSGNGTREPRPARRRCLILAGANDNRIARRSDHTEKSNPVSSVPSEAVDGRQGREWTGNDDVMIAKSRMFMRLSGTWSVDDERFMEENKIYGPSRNRRTSH